MVWAPEGSFGRPVEQEAKVGPGAWTPAEWRCQLSALSGSPCRAIC